MPKLEWKKEYKEFYQPKVGKVAEVDVPKMHALMIDGTGDPNNSEQFQTAVEALYGLSYTIKFTLKKDKKEYTVFPLEGLWWAKDMNVFADPKADRSSWQWTIFIIQPEFVTKKMVEEAKVAVEKKRGKGRLDEVRFEDFTEGKAVQLMHIGPYSTEGPNIMKLHNYIKDHDWKLSGKHHEIYLSDPRRNPAKTKTVIRQPYSE